MELIERLKNDLKNGYCPALNPNETEVVIGIIKERELLRSTRMSLQYTKLYNVGRIEELIDWLDSECPEGTEETFDLSHDFTEKLRHRIENIKSK